MWRCHSKGPVNKLANRLSNWIYFKGHPFSLTVRCSWPSKSSNTLFSSVTSLPSIPDSSLIAVVCCLSIGSLMNSRSPVIPPSRVIICLYPPEHYSEGLPWEHANSTAQCWLSPIRFPFFCGRWGRIFPEMTNQPTLIMAQKARQWKSSGDQMFCQLVLLMFSCLVMEKKVIHLPRLSVALGRYYHQAVIAWFYTWLNGCPACL